MEKQEIGDQKNGADDDGGVGDIKRRIMPLLDMKVQKIGDFSAQNAVAEIPGGAAENQRAPEGLAEGGPCKPQIHGDSTGYAYGNNGEQNAGGSAGVREKSKGGPGIFHKNQTKKRQDADGGFRRHQGADDLLGSDIQDEDDGGNRHPEEELAGGAVHFLRAGMRSLTEAEAPRQIYFAGGGGKPAKRPPAGLL